LAVKVCNALGTLILVAIIVCSGTILVLRFLGYQPMAVLSGSMEPVYNVGGLVFIDTNVAAEEIGVGDVITYNLTEDMIVTHRVIAVDAPGRAFTTKGDANNAPDLAAVPFGSLIGKATFHIPMAGYVMMDLFTYKGLAAGAMLAGLLIILFAVPALLKAVMKGGGGAGSGGKPDEAPEAPGGQEG
jgi:signal peptidase